MATERLRMREGAGPIDDGRKLVRAMTLFELTFLVSGSQTLVVALYDAAFAAGIRPGQSIKAMAVIYMVTSPVLLLAALRFINPVNMVVHVRP